MPRINLLPWREQARRERQRKFNFAAGGMAIFSALVVAFVHIQIAGRIDTQERRNQFLKDTIADVEKRIQEIKDLKKEKEALLARMNIIQALQTSRPQVVHVFDELARAVPEDVYLISLNRKGNTLQIEGVADSNAGVSAFMRRLDASRWLTNPKLSVIDSSKREYPGASWFSLTVSEVNTAAGTEEKAK